MAVIDDLREKARNLPLKPGVYIMLDKTGQVIYVGKAKQLKNRVSSYFHGEHNVKTTVLVSKIADFNVIIANSEFEALVLENQLIKRHMPKYNILLKDDKGYPFVRLDVKSQYPKFTIASRTAEDGARYFGPFGGRSATKDAIDAICKALKLPTCGRKFPRDIGKERPCLNYHMGNCRAYCLKDASADEYRSSINEAVMILEGKTGELTGMLRKEMEQAAEELRFERAAELRDRIKAISLLQHKQRVISGAMADTDVAGYYRGEARSCFVVLHFIGGQLLDKDFELLDNPMEDDGEAVSALIRQYYLIRGVYPKTVYLPCDIQDLEPLELLLEQNAGRRVYLQTPKRGEKLRLVETANLNAREEVERVTTGEEKTLKTLEWLKKALDMENYPERIEAFDISNTGSSDIVASMTVFINGRPLKRDYRKFKIKSLETQDDYHSMAEVIERRFKRYLDGDKKFGDMPDLLLIDGGDVHARTALEVVERMGLHIPAFGMVKDDRHRTRALISPDGHEIGIAANPAVFSFIGNIQEETHRFAIEYHRSLHSKNSRGSRLDAIPGVGEKRRNDLLRAFKSIKAISGASEEKLRTVVPKNTAAAVYNYFHEEKANESNNGDGQGQEAPGAGGQ